jgi:hypothetical protein
VGRPKYLPPWESKSSLEWSVESKKKDERKKKIEIGKVKERGEKKRKKKGGERKKRTKPPFDHKKKHPRRFLIGK